MPDLLTCHEAAKALKIDLLYLVDILAIGDIHATAPDGLHGAEVWSRNEEIRLSQTDIELIKAELRRRSFVDFKTEYADILSLDPRPRGRGLEFGPGWIGILQTYADGLRALVIDGRQAAKLRWGKEKFGALRLFSDYTLAVEKEVINLHRDAYRTSLVTCQECGVPARLRFGHSVCLALCQRHSHIVGEPDPSRDGVILDLDAWALQESETKE